MNTKTIEMPDVGRCDVSGCAYNADNGCRARAITIGDGTFPGCDTFLSSSGITMTSRIAGVGACKVSGCKFNEELECQTEQITIAGGGAQPVCETFAT